MQMKQCSLINRNLSSSDKGKAVVHPMPKMSHRTLHRYGIESNYWCYNSRSFCNFLAYPD